jgi:hypothetical protein
MEMLLRSMYIISANVTASSFGCVQGSGLAQRMSTKVMRTHEFSLIDIVAM